MQRRRAKPNKLSELAGIVASLSGGNTYYETVGNSRLLTIAMPAQALVAVSIPMRGQPSRAQTRAIYRALNL